MPAKSVFFSIAVILTLSIMAGCTNTASSPVPETPTATPTEETAATEEESTATSPVPEDPTATPTEETVDIEETNTDGPRTGDMAPDFTLPDGDGNMVHLADELKNNRMVILVFYESYG